MSGTISETNTLVNPALLATRELTEPEFRATFRTFIPRLQHQFFKFERLQEYSEPGDPSYEYFRKGELTSATKHLEDRLAAQGDFYLRLCRENIPFVRVRALEFPISAYLEYEFNSYEISARYGERILIVDLSSPSAAPYVYSSDFVMFDDVAVLAHNYSETGLLKGAWLIDDSHNVRPFVEFANHLIAASVPLAMFQRQRQLK